MIYIYIFSIAIMILVFVACFIVLKCILDVVYILVECSVELNLKMEVL